MTTILTISDRGQITIPKTLRNQIGVKRVICNINKDNQIILEPLQTKEEFLAELDQTEKDWEKNGGFTLEEVKKELNL